MASEVMSERKQYPVVIIGSGFAGTAAAISLANQGIEYIILEATHYTGGRTQTMQFSPELSVDTGACFIHGANENPLIHLCRTLGVPLKQPFDYQTVLFFANGNPSHHQIQIVRKEFYARKKQAKRFLREEFQKGNVDLSMEDGLNETIRIKKFPWAADSVEQKYFNFLKWIHEEYEGADWEDTSILQFDGNDFSGGNAELQYGYQSLLGPLQAPLNIKTQSEVKHIQYDGNTAIITVLDLQTFQYTQYECQFVICTVSLGVLQKSLQVDVTVPIENLEQGLLRFHPPLPDWKRESIESFKMGLMDKVILQFPEHFWGNVGRITHVGDVAGDYPWFDSVSHDPPVLLAWTACKFADNITALVDEQILAHCMSILRKVYPDAPAPIFAHITRWRTNPYTRGSYSFVAKGATIENVSNFPLPVQNIYFAGEAYSRDHIGCVHGAYITGQQAAESVISRLLNK